MVILHFVPIAFPCNCHNTQWRLVGFLRKEKHIVLMARITYLDFQVPLSARSMLHAGLVQRKYPPLLHDIHDGVQNLFDPD
jgi:hypothetical protein